MMITYDIRPFHKVKAIYRCGWIFRFGGWEFFTPDTVSKLFMEDNADCPAIGLPVPPNPAKRMTQP